MVKDCFTGQSPGKAIFIPAAPDVSLGSLGAGWDTAGVRGLDWLGLRREAGWYERARFLTSMNRSHINPNGTPVFMISHQWGRSHLIPMANRRRPSQI